MRTLKILTLFLIFIGCETYDECRDIYSNPGVLEYSEDTTYRVDVIVKHVVYDGVLDKQDVGELGHYINGYIYNKYDIYINFIDGGSIKGHELSAELSTIKRTLFVIHDDYYKLSNRGIAIGQAMKVRRSAVYSATTAHEIAHTLGVGHIKGEALQNVMDGHTECFERYYFNEDQISIMKNRLIPIK